MEDFIGKEKREKGKFEKGNEEDHFAHARNYSEIALQLAASNDGPDDIKDVL